MPAEVEVLDVVPVGPARLLFADGEYVNDGAELLAGMTGTVELL